MASLAFSPCSFPFSPHSYEKQNCFVPVHPPFRLFPLCSVRPKANRRCHLRPEARCGSHHGCIPTCQGQWLWCHLDGERWLFLEQRSHQSWLLQSVSGSWLHGFRGGPWFPAEVSN